MMKRTMHKLNLTNTYVALSNETGLMKTAYEFDQHTCTIFHMGTKN
jgi:hypothetical protein